MMHVLLDTEVFRSENLHFSSKRFSRLVELVRQDSAKVYVTDVTIGEIRSAIASSVRQAIEFLRPKSTRRILSILAQSETASVSGIVERLDERALIAELNSKFDALMKDLRTVIIATDSVSIAELRRRYFESIPPFRSGTKKHEFPDALSILAAEARASKDRLRLYVVSADKDLKEAVKCAPSLEHVETLHVMIGRVHESVEATASFVAAAQKAAEELLNDIVAGFRENFLESGFYVEDEWNEEVDDVTVCGINLDEPIGNYVAGNVVTLGYMVEIEFTAEAKVGDPSQTAYDSETRETYVFGYLSRDISDTVWVEGEVEIEVDISDPSNSKILSISLSKSDYGVTFPWE